MIDGTDETTDTGTDTGGSDTTDSGAAGSGADTTQDGGDNAGGAGGEGGAGSGKETEDTRTPFEKKLDGILEGTDGGATDGGENDDDAEAGAQGKAGAGDEGGEGAGEDEPIVLTFPGRKEDDEDFTVELDDEAIALLEKKGIDVDELVERANQAKNGYERRRAIEAERRELDAERENMEWIRTELRERPLDFVADHIDGKQHAGVVETLLARMDDATFDAVVEKAAQWRDDPASRKEARADAREAASKRKEERTVAEQTARARKEYTNQIADQITTLVPDDMPEEQADEFYDFAAHKLQAWASRQPKGTRLDPAKVPQLLEQLGALKPFGLTLPKAGKPGASKAGTRDTAGTRNGGRPAGKKPQDRTQAAARAGQDLRDRRNRRRDATTTQSGAGGAAAASLPPKGQTFAQRIEWLSKRIGAKK